MSWNIDEVNIILQNIDLENVQKSKNRRKYQDNMSVETILLWYDKKLWTLFKYRLRIKGNSEDEMDCVVGNVEESEWFRESFSDKNRWEFGSIFSP